MLFFTGRVVTKRFIFPYGLFRENAFGVALRLRSNESPSGAFKRQNVLAGARWRGLAPTSSAGLAVLLFHEDKLLLVQRVFVWGRFVWLL